MKKTFEDAKRLFPNYFLVKDCGYKTPCWMWKSPDPNRGGYGRVWFSNQHIDAHRFSWLIHRGNISSLIEVCHHCDNPPCVNPDHLFLGTHTDNMRDAYSKKRIPALKGELNGQCKLTESAVVEIRKSFKRGIVTYRMLATKFGVDLSTIALIVKRKNWKHVT